MQHPVPFGVYVGMDMVNLGLYNQVLRLLESEMRQFVYRVKLNDAPDIWGPMLIVGQSFVDQARQDWVENALPSLKLSDLHKVLPLALRMARKSTTDLLQDQVPEVKSLVENLECPIEYLVSVSIADVGALG